MTLVTPGEPDDLATQVRSIAGITDVYTPGSALRRLPSIIASATGTGGEPVADVLVVGGADQVTTVAARVATSADGSSTEAARRVADVLLANAPANAQISLQIARIH